MDFRLKASGTALPAPVRIRSDDETIWSENTGRSASGSMVGTIIARKRTFEIEWGVLSSAEMKRIVDASSKDEFFQLEITEYGETTTITCYRGPITKEAMGYVGDGVFYYRSASVSFIQK